MQRLWGNIILVLMALCVLAACGEERQRGRGAADTTDGASSKQVITEKGSDTMILLAQRWAEAFGKTHPNIQIQVTGGGSGTGISALINGTTDIANSSRAMKEDERKQVRERYGSDVVEI